MSGEGGSQGNPRLPAEVTSLPPGVLWRPTTTNQTPSAMDQAIAEYIREIERTGQTKLPGVISRSYAENPVERRLPLYLSSSNELLREHLRNEIRRLILTGRLPRPEPGGIDEPRTDVLDEPTVEAELHVGVRQSVTKPRGFLPRANAFIAKYERLVYAVPVTMAGLVLAGALTQLISQLGAVRGEGVASSTSAGVSFTVVLVAFYLSVGRIIKGLRRQARSAKEDGEITDPELRRALGMDATAALPKASPTTLVDQGPAR